MFEKKKKGGGNFLITNLLPRLKKKKKQTLNKYKHRQKHNLLVLTPLTEVQILLFFHILVTQLWHSSQLASSF